jgi:hypothetical protein
MSTQAIDLIEAVAQAVAQLRQKLDKASFVDLEDALVQTQRSLDALNLFPGGPEGLRMYIGSLPPDEKERANLKLEQARFDHQVNAELLALAMQRNAALQAYAAQSSQDATYSSDGGFQMGSSGQLLGKF